MRTLPDYLRKGMRMILVGANPGDRSARVGHLGGGEEPRCRPYARSLSLGIAPFGLGIGMMLTFLTLAQHQGLTPVGYESEAEGLLENVEGKYHITEVAVRPHVTLKNEAELELARKTMESVEAHCFIANSINARVKLTPEFVVAPSPK